MKIVHSSRIVIVMEVIEMGLGFRASDTSLSITLTQNCTNVADISYQF